MSRNSDRLRPLALAAALAASASGCTSPYVERRETLALHAGNAAAANRAIHTIDPWPAAAARTDIEVSGRRIVDAIERYEAGKPPNGGVAAPGLMALPIAMPPAAPAK